MNESFGMPGPGGSLGQCAVCGKTFMRELITGESVAPFTVGFLDVELYAHVPACKEKIVEVIMTAQQVEADTGDNIAAVVALRDALPKTSILVEPINVWLEESQKEMV